MFINRSMNIGSRGEQGAVLVRMISLFSIITNSRFSFLSNASKQSRLHSTLPEPSDQHSIHPVSALGAFLEFIIVRSILVGSSMV